MERVARETSLHPGWIRIFLFLPLNSQKLLWRIATNVEAYNVRLGSGGRQIVPPTERDKKRARQKASLQPPRPLPWSKSTSWTANGTRRRSHPTSLVSICLYTTCRLSTKCGNGGGLTEETLTIGRTIFPGNTHNSKHKRADLVVRMKWNSLKTPRLQRRLERR